MQKFVRGAVAALAITGFAALAGCASNATSDGPKDAGQVVVPDPGGVLGEAMTAAFFEPFEKETGIEVVLASGEFDTAVVLAGVKAGAPAFDIAAINASALSTFRAEDAIQPIDYSVWAEGVRDEIAPVKAGDDAVPSYYIAMVPAWNSTTFADAAPDSWADLWDTTQFPGKRALGPGSWGAGGATYEIALLADGVKPDELYPIDFDRAFASLDKLGPDLAKYWETGAEPIQLLTGGQVTAASAWNGRVEAGIAEGAPVKSTWNQAILQYDNWVILGGAKNAENAQKLLAFMMEAENQAAFAEGVSYSPANQAAFDTLPASRVALLPTAPENASTTVTQNYDWWTSPSGDGDKSNEELSIELWQAWING